jgi:hypothetical protein
MVLTIAGFDAVLNAPVMSLTALVPSNDARYRAPLLPLTQVTSAT